MCVCVRQLPGPKRIITSYQYNTHTHLKYSDTMKISEYICQSRSHDGWSIIVSIIHAHFSKTSEIICKVNNMYKP